MRVPICIGLLAVTPWVSAQAVIGLGGRRLVVDDDDRLPATLPATRPANLDGLLKQLSSGEWQVRQKAQDQVVEIGREAEPALTKLRAETNDDEVRTRVDATPRQIEENDLTVPTRVTLHVKDMFANDVLAELGRQAGVNVAVNTDRKARKRVTIDAVKQPFWVVAKEVCRQAGLSPCENYDEKDRPTIQFSVDDDAFGSMPCINQGCVTLVLDSAIRERTMNFGKRESTNDGTLHLRVLNDPKCDLTYRKIDVAELVDEKGNSLRVRDEREKYGIYWGLTKNFQVKFRDLPQGGKSIARFAGTFKAVAYGSQTLEFSDFPSIKNVTRDTRACKFTLISVAKGAGGKYVVKASIEPKARPFRCLAEIAELSLVDAKGREWKEKMEEEVDAFQHNYELERGQGAGEPVKLIWRIPVQAEVIEFPFEFKDLPLP